MYGGRPPIIDMIADAKERGLFDRKNRPRTVAKPTVANTPGAPFARIVAGAKTDDQQLRALEAAAQREVALPADAFVVGEPVTAAAISYSGHPRAGLTLWGVRGDRRFSVGLADVAFPPGSAGARFVSVYRAWLGFGELSSDPEPYSAAPAARHKVTGDDIAVGSPVELIVLACKSNALRCRLLGTAREVTLRTAIREEVPGGIIRVMPTKQWTHARHAYLAGNLLSIRADVEALGLTPLAVHEQGEWDPKTEYWGEEGERIEEWAKPIIARGKRPMFELEQVLPGADAEDFDSDPIVEASELNAAGDRAHARGAFSLGRKFDGVLAWGLIDNRPFLRCMLGVGLCAWRFGNTRDAAAVFRKMLWLNPSDNQGARFNLAAIEAGKTWEEMEGDE